MSKLWNDFDKQLLTKLLEMGALDPPTFIKKFNDSANEKRTPGGLWSRIRRYHKDRISEEFYTAFTAFMNPILQKAQKAKKAKIAEEGGPWVDIREATRILHVTSARVHQLAKKGTVRRKVIDEATNLVNYSKPDLLAYYETRPAYHNIRLKALAAKKQKPMAQMALNFTSKPEPKPVSVTKTVVEKILTEKASNETVPVAKVIEMTTDYAAERKKARVVLEALALGVVTTENAIDQLRKMFLPS